MSVYCPKCGADIENMCLECEDVAALQARIAEVEKERDLQRESADRLQAELAREREDESNMEIRYEDEKRRADKAEARVKSLEGEKAAIKTMHARILSWPPEDVERAYTALLQLAATEAHAGGDGKTARDAVDALRRHESQVEAERDALQARVKELEERLCMCDALSSIRPSHASLLKQVSDLRAKLAEVERERDEERRTRIFYQGRAYYACNMIDKVLGLRRGNGTTLGTAEHPDDSDFVQNCTKVIEKLKGGE